MSSQLHPLISSKRCHGVVSGGPLNRANQAAPLRVSDLVLLHETPETSDDDWNRLMSGAVGSLSVLCICKGTVE